MRGFLLMNLPNRTFSQICSFLSCFSLLLCGSIPSNASPIKKRIVTLTTMSSDVVSLITSDSIVGVPGSSLINGNRVYDNVVRISQGRNQPDFEKIISLRPDLVVGSSGFHDNVLSKLSSLGLDTITYQLNSFDQLQGLVDDIASKVGVDSKSVDSLIPSCRYTNSEQGEPVLILASLKPLISPTSNSWSGSLLRHLGILNLTSTLNESGRFSGYTTLSPEWIITAKPPKLILVAFQDSDFANQFKDLNFWKNVEAVKQDKVSTMPYYGLINPGSFASINAACKILRSTSS